MFWTLAWAAVKAAAGFVGSALWAAAQWAIANPLAAALVVSLGACGLLWHEKSTQAEAFTKTLQAMTADRDAERTRADAAEKGRATALAANATLNATVQHLATENAKATELAASAKAAGAQALVDLTRARAALKASTARETALRSQLYATDPDVSVWGALPVPRALAGRLLESARQTAAP
jgi:hypothetical protein